MSPTRPTNPRPRRSARAAWTALAAALAVPVLAACGASTPAATTEARPAAFTRELHDRLPTEIRSAGVIRVGTDASYAPASFFGPDGRTIVGFEPDLAAAMGDVLGVRFKMVNVDFTAALPLVRSHRVDAVMSAMTDTRERQEQVDFIDYFSAGTAILVQRGNPHGVSDLRGLCGTTVAVEEGTIQVELLERTNPGCAGRPLTINTFPTNSDALLQLRTGRAAAVLTDYPPAVYLTTGAKTRRHYQLASTAQYEPGPYGIAVAKDRTQLRDVLYDTIAQLMRSGAYKEALHRWSVTDGALSAPTINAGSTTPSANPTT